MTSLPSNEIAVRVNDRDPDHMMRESHFNISLSGVYKYEEGDYMEWNDLNENTRLDLLFGDIVTPPCGKVAGTTCNCTTEKQLSDTILTPFYHTMALPDVGHIYNHEPYTIYALKTRIAPDIKKIKPSYGPRFPEMKYDGKMYTTMEIYEGAKFVPLRGALHSKVKSILYDDLANSVTHTACLLLHAEQPIMYHGVCLSAEWLQTIINTLFSPYGKCVDVASNGSFRERCDIFRNGYIFSHNNRVYVDLTDVDILDFVNLKVDVNPKEGDTSRYRKVHSHETAYERLYIKLIKFLVDLYKVGSVVLDSERNVDMIKNFHLEVLVKVELPRNSSEISRKLSLCVMSYRDYRLPNMTRFLTSYLEGRPYMDVKCSRDMTHTLKKMGVRHVEVSGTCVVEIDSLITMQMILYYVDRL